MREGGEGEGVRVKGMQQPGDVAFNLGEAVSALASLGCIMVELLFMPYLYVTGRGEG